MAFGLPGRMRETGTALAVLAIYVLTLLAPLHQAAGLQRDLAALGFETASFWSICDAAAPEGGTEKPAAPAECPVAGAGKHEFAGPPPAVTGIPAPAAASLPPPAEAPVSRRGTPAHFSQSRAPPV